MATVEQFVAAMEEVYKNHGVYIGTANGERTLDFTIEKIFKYEENYGRRDSAGNPLWYSDAARDLEYIAKLRRAKTDLSKSRAGDCSGIIVGVLRDLGVLAVNEDLCARDFQRLSDHVDLNNLQPGDFVFDNPTKAGHIGTYVGDGMVIDSRGRDVGVVKKPLSDYAWKDAGRFPRFEGSIPPLLRNLMYIKGNLMKGDDVRQCQLQLTNKGYNAGVIDGVFSTKTLEAVLCFQSNYGLEIDGVVGQKTWTALFS